MVPVSEDDDTQQTAAEMRSLADQAEAEAAEAEALAAAARARARAIQLRRDADVVEAAEEVKATEEVRADAEEPVQTDVEAPRSEDERPGAPLAVEVVETQEIPDDTVDESDAEVADEMAAEVADEPATKQRRGWRSRFRRPSWSTIAVAVAIIAILLALSGSGYLVLGHRHATEQHRRAAEFAAAARQGVVTLTSLDFDHAKEGVQNIVEVSTGSFKDDFVKMADDFTKVVQESKVVSQGSVQADAVDLDSMTDNSAVVLVVSTSEVTNAAGAKQDPRKYRLIVTVTRDGGQLKLSKVEFLP